MGDKSGTDGLSEKGGQVRGNEVHLLDEVSLEGLSVRRKVDDSVGKVGDVNEVDGGDIGTHGGSGTIEDISGSGLVVVEDFLHLLEVGLGESRLVTDELGDLGVLVVVGDKPDKLGEVPSVPLSDSHGKGVDILVELIGKSDSLDDHVVGSVDVELKGGHAHVGQTIYKVEQKGALQRTFTLARE